MYTHLHIDMYMQLKIKIVYFPFFFFHGVRVHVHECVHACVCSQLPEKNFESPELELEAAECCVFEYLCRHMCDHESILEEDGNTRSLV